MGRSLRRSWLRLLSPPGMRLPFACDMKTFTYQYTQRPRYLQDCFYWKGRGYHYSHAAPLAMLSAGEPPDDDPWAALAWVLERAKQADFGHVSKLRRLILDERNAPTLVSACLGLTADTGLDGDLDFLAELMIDGPDHLRIEASFAAHWSGVMWLVPFMLEARRALSRRADRESIEANISDLLDPIDAAEPQFYDSGLSEDEYANAVGARLHQLRCICGNDKASISGGASVDMNLQVALMKKSLEPRDAKDWVDWGNFLIWRRKFEVYSGVDCSAFYRGGIFQPRAAEVILNRYSAAPVEFAVGKRYFFGHLVPQ